MVKKYTVIDRIDAIVKWIILIIVGVFMDGSQCI